MSYGIVHTRYEHGLLCQNWVRSTSKSENKRIISYRVEYFAQGHAKELNADINTGTHHVRTVEDEK